jgi:hypothetical protein
MPNRALRCDLGSQLQRLWHQLFQRHAAFHHAGAIQFISRHAPPSVEHAPRARAAEQRLQHRRAAGEADIDLWHAELRIVGAEDDIAGRRQPEAGAESRTIHRGDYRLGAFGDGVETFPRQPVEVPVLARMVRIGPLPHVGTGREHPSGSGQDRHAHIVAIGQRVEGGDQFLANLRVLCVDRWTVHHHGGDSVLHCQFDRTAHGCSSIGIPDLR